ncbi:MAG: YfcE family phosphodiesterase [Planctomycetaceae bacterium]|nr:YfcE family phosphodiesterase [Planctomycetaceae bacterium]
MTDHASSQTLRLGVVSDTHGHVDYAMNAVRLLESLEVNVVLHCGDIGTSDVVRLFQRWPTHFVFGNVDDSRELRETILAAGQTCHDWFGDITLAGRRIALLHSDDAVRFESVKHSGQYDLVCYGHTHKALQQTIGKTLVLNPGALYRAYPHSFAIVDLPELKVTSINV